MAIRPSDPAAAVTVELVRGVLDELGVKPRRGKRPPPFCTAALLLSIGNVVAGCAGVWSGKASIDAPGIRVRANGSGANCPDPNAPAGPDAAAANRTAPVDEAR